MRIEKRKLFKIKSEQVDELKVVAKSLEDAISIYRHLNEVPFELFKVEYVCSVEVEVGND